VCSPVPTLLSLSISLSCSVLLRFPIDGTYTRLLSYTAI
jgi:hypothetical protein